MKKFFLILLALLLLSPVGLFATEELELGIALTPIGPLNKNAEDDAPPTDLNDTEQEADFFDEWLLALHGAYSWDMWYASLDALVLAPWFVKDMTSGPQIDENGDEFYFPGIYAPGFLFFIDGGVKLEFGDFIAFGEMGFNWLYIYKGQLTSKLGSNLRLGGRYRITREISVGLTLTSIFPDFGTMLSTIGDSFSSDEYIRQDAADRMKFVPMLACTFHL